MNERISHILAQMSALEDELLSELQAQESRLVYKIEGKRVKFEHSVREAHQRIKVGMLRWLLTVRPQNFLTAPIIYGLILPLLLLDLCVSFYQLTCFPIYGIPRVKRSSFFIYDHQHLAYLNIIEKVDCMYCSYANGLMAFAREITARTEQYFCPIKHAHKILGAHARYIRFLEYGETDGFEAKLEEFRAALAAERDKL